MIQLNQAGRPRNADVATSIGCELDAGAPFAVGALPQCVSCKWRLSLPAMRTKLRLQAIERAF
jgi:hypothetical protein